MGVGRVDETRSALFLISRGFSGSASAQSEPSPFWGGWTLIAYAEAAQRNSLAIRSPSVMHAQNKRPGIAASFVGRKK
jgi:hypothetical protein